eukprot:1157945-Pelagomonas_calceolata.AAC.4
MHAQGDGAANGDRIGGSEVNGPGPPISSGGARGGWGGSDRPPLVMTARQRARMADLSLLLDVILKTTSATVKRDFVACGVLNQLQQVGTADRSGQSSVGGVLGDHTFACNRNGLGDF